MKKFTLVFLLFSTPVFFSSCDTLQQIANETLSEPSMADIGMGLKEALNKGVSKGVNELSRTDGYFKSIYKILLPPEARQVTEKLKVVPGFTNLENELLEKINRGAEDAAKEAGPIFVTAIKGITFQNAANILMGADNAATEYLHNTTYDPLYAKFNPKIVSALDKIGANNLWKKAADAYNKIPLVNKVNNDLGDYVTTEALKGLFSKIQEEEKNIRRNPVSRTTSLLKKVFSKQDANRK